MMKITVLGCGSIGKLWIAGLTQQAHEVQGWLRIPQPDFDVNVDSINGIPFQQRIIANQKTWLQHSELLLVCLKSWQVSDAVNALIPHLSA
ncbi:2-dehydropantoate 2-reductase, partial [Proteus mirabilis]